MRWLSVHAPLALTAATYFSDAERREDALEDVARCNADALSHTSLHTSSLDPAAIELLV